MDTIDKILEQRENTHGVFKTQALISQDLKDIVRYSERWDMLKPYQKEAIDMILHKIARAINGKSDEQDHWLDIIGYATLVLNYIKESNDDKAEEFI